MTDGLEEKEGVVQLDFDNHHHASGNDIQQRYDVNHPEDVENHVPWACQGAFEEASHKGKDCLRRRDIGSRPAVQSRKMEKESRRELTSRRY